jgi:16S rRNA (uracil1498-N3)-methyltransferase
MAHFYLLDELEGTTVGASVLLSGAEGRHAATVSRVRVGEVLGVGNGRGLMLVAKVTLVEKDSVTLQVESVSASEPLSPRLVLVQALAKNDRDERAVEACTELGIDAITPWAAERSISRWEGPKIAKGQARWGAIAREASKQSIRPYVPVILPYAKAAAVLASLQGHRIIVLDPRGDRSLSDVDLETEVLGESALVGIALVVGPEGGITDGELALFREHGATIATLGKNILRTSTAGPAALAIVSSRLRRL